MRARAFSFSTHLLYMCVRLCVCKLRTRVSAPLFAHFAHTCRRSRARTH